jgi:hypothetical protein
MKLKKQVLGYFAFTLTGIAAAGLLSLISLISAPVIAQQASVAIDNDDIGGIVRGPGGPEAGVWVIAETTELPTKFAKIVVTDDQGRFVILWCAGKHGCHTSGLMLKAKNINGSSCVRFQQVGMRSETSVVSAERSPQLANHPMSHRPLWISNFTKPSSRIFNSRDWQVSSFTTLARFMTS